MATIGSWRRLGMTAAGALLALGLGGCEESSPASQAVQDAALELEMLAMGGGKPALTEDRLKEGYSTVLTSLHAAETGPAGSRRSAASSLAAQAQLGLAAVAMSDAMEAELACARKETEIRNLQGHWVNLQALQASLSAFDPAGEIDWLEEERTGRAAEVTAAQQRLAEAEAELDDMRQRITSLEEQARTKWREETEIRQSAVDLDEVSRKPLIEEATHIKRQGDALDRQASEMRAVLESREPELRDIEAEIDRLTTQGEQLSQAIKALQEEHAQRQQLADGIGEEAAGVAQRIAEMSNQLTGLREGVPAAWQAVLDACDAASSKAGGASGTASDLGQIQSGAAEQLRADALSRQAAGLESYAATLRLLAETEPAIPGTDQFAQRADAADRQAAELRKVAGEAYRVAAEAFGSLAGDHDRVARSMKDLQDQLSKKAGDPPAPEEVPMEEAPVDEPAEPEPAAG